MSLKFEVIKALVEGGPQTMRRLEATTKAGKQAIRHHLDALDIVDIISDGDGDPVRFGSANVYRLEGDERQGPDLLEEWLLHYQIDRHQLRRDVLAAMTSGPHDRNSLENELDAMDHCINRDHMNRVIRELKASDIAVENELGIELTGLGYDLARRLWPS